MFRLVLPKVHLHCHLEGTLRAESFLELAEKRGVPLTYRPSAPGEFTTATAVAERPQTARDVYGFTTFEEFLLTFAAVSRALREPEDYARLADEFARDALAQRVVYGELFVSPSVWRFFHPEIDVRACTQAIRGALDDATRGSGVRFNLIVDLTRNFGAESALQTARAAVAMTDLGVVGVGLGGDEARFPPASFADAFAYARANGLHCVAHAGEAAGPESVRAAVELLGAERIGHGIRALEDPAVLGLLVQRQIALEICPTSNFLTGVASRERAHPILDLDAAGCPVVVDADDPALFRTSISDEYAYVAGLAGEATLARFVGNAIEASFAEPAEKVRLQRLLRAACAELPERPRR